MRFPFLTAALALVALPALADGLRIIDPFARVIGPSGAAYFRLVNPLPKEDVLLAASSPDARMVMLMQSQADASGMMKMVGKPEGFVIPAQGQALLENGSGHVMLMSLTHPIKAGDKITLILTFKEAGQVSVILPVDNKRKTGPGAGPTPNDVTAQ